mmetsp:Transcript_15325/g.35325  ORF Transcript_15325/g.35325 Transcript_15325/m.35325 type:complete len:81 (-) Transcript_15325:33-275(-)
MANSKESGRNLLEKPVPSTENFRGKRRRGQTIRTEHDFLLQNTTTKEECRNNLSTQQQELASKQVMNKTHSTIRLEITND